MLTVQLLLQKIKQLPLYWQGDVEFEAGGIITVFSWVHTEHQTTVSLNMSQHTVQLMITLLQGADLH